jgi:C4-dicarboxylate transporter DctM subunit
MSEGGVSRRLVNLAGAFFGRMSGGLALVATVASTFFGALSGSAPATTAAIGGVMIKPMVEKGYDKNFAGAVVAASGTIGLIIPPSLTMVLYGVSTGVSIGALFLGGIIPGIIICIALMIVEYIISVKRGYRGEEKTSMKTILKYCREAVFAIFMPVLILGGIYAGIFTPTESAAVAVVYGLIVGLFIHREISFRDLPKLILKSAKSTALVMYLMVTAEVLSFVLVSEQIPQTIASSILGFSNNAIVVQLIMVLILLIIGTFLNNTAAMVLMAPIFYPIITSLGIDPLFFGIIMVIALAIGHNTPPVGMCLFIACDIGNIKLESLVKEVMPLVAAMIVVVVALNFFPEVILYLPNMMK